MAKKPYCNLKLKVTLMKQWSVKIICLAVYGCNLKLSCHMDILKRCQGLNTPRFERVGEGGGEGGENLSQVCFGRKQFYWESGDQLPVVGRIFQGNMTWFWNITGKKAKVDIFVRLSPKNLRESSTFLVGLEVTHSVTRTTFVGVLTPRKKK